MKFIKNIFILIFFYFFLINYSWSQSASEFISSVTTEASNILSSKLTDEEKIIQLKKIGEMNPDLYALIATNMLISCDSIFTKKS